MQHLPERYDIETREEWRKWMGRIPAIEFPAGWQVKVIPPFGGAMARFRVLAGGKDISVYLDVFDRLGCVGAPYWEVYPYQGDVGRVPMDDVSGLIAMIQETVDEETS